MAETTVMVSAVEEESRNKCQVFVMRGKRLKMKFVSSFYYEQHEAIRGDIHYPTHFERSDGGYFLWQNVIIRFID